MLETIQGGKFLMNMLNMILVNVGIFGGADSSGDSEPTQIARDYNVVIGAKMLDDILKNYESLTWRKCKQNGSQLNFQILND